MIDWTSTEDRDWIQSLTPAKVLVGRFQLEQQLASSRSLTGQQLERVEEGLGGSRGAGGASRNIAELLACRLSTLSVFCRALSRREERVCRARYGSVAGVTIYTDVRPLADLREGDGEDIIDMRPQSPDGELLKGCVQVRGVRARFPSYVEIGQGLGLTAHQVHHLLNTSRAKIGRALRQKALHR